MVGKMLVKREIFSHLLALDDYLLALTFYDEYHNSGNFAETIKTRMKVK